jgi:hypothetical protein
MNNNLQTTADYTNTTGIVSKYSPALEGMAVFKIPNGKHVACCYTQHTANISFLLLTVLSFCF